jgi:hypothetical protein
MKLLDYLNLVSSFNGKTIRLPVAITPSNIKLLNKPEDHQLILDTGADNSALTEEFLMQNGYSNFQNSGAKKRTATGEVELLTCEVSGFTIANQFKISKIKVDVLTGWEEHAVVGLIGMDILSRLTFVLSHEQKKFMLTAQPVPELAKLFAWVCAGLFCAHSTPRIVSIKLLRFTAMAEICIMAKVMATTPAAQASIAAQGGEKVMPMGWLASPTRNIR